MAAGDDKKLKKYQVLALCITFLSYASYHMSRKSASIVKSVLHPISDGKSKYDPVSFPGFKPFSNDLVPEVVAQHGLSVTKAGLPDARGDYKCASLLEGICLSYTLDGKYTISRTTNTTIIGRLGYSPLKSAWIIHADPAKSQHCQSKDLLLTETCVIYAQGSDSLLPAPGTSNPKNNPKEWDWKCVVPSLLDDDLPKVQPTMTSGEVLLGYCDTVFLSCYSIGLFFSGHLADRFPLKWFLGLGMIGTGIFVSLIGMALYWEIHNLGYFMAVYAIQGFFQATGWPAVVAVVARWLGKGKRGLVMGIWNSHTSVGNIMGSTISAAALGLGYNGHNWGMAFVIPGITIAVVGLGVIMVLVTDPEEVGLQSPLDKHEDTITVSVQDPLLPKESGRGFADALRIPGVIEFSLCLFLAKLVAYVFIYWLPYYLSHLNYTSSYAGFLSSFIDVGGIVGGVLAGQLSDWSGRSATVSVAFLLCATPILWGYRAITNQVRDSSAIINILCMLAAGAVVNGPYALITTAVSADLGTHPSLRGDMGLMATVTGIIDGTGSAGAALQGVLIGVVDDAWGWDAVFYLLMVCCGIAAVMLLRLVRKELSKPQNSEGPSRGGHDTTE